MFYNGDAELAPGLKGWSVDERVAILNDPGTKYTTKPDNVLKCATFMNEIGSLKNKPASIPDLFFDTPEVAAAIRTRIDASLITARSLATRLSYRIAPRRHCLILLKNRSIGFLARYRYGRKPIGSLRFRFGAVQSCFPGPT
jgi:hypothetical protein